MNLFIPYNIFEINKIVFQKPVENKIKYYNHFYRILYNEAYYTIQNVIISIPESHIITNYHNKTYKISFNNDLLYSLFYIEYELLKKINLITNKKIERLLYNDCMYKHYVLHLNKPSNQLFIRISGIWESNDKIGITYKFISK
ncbi:hypothetical protein 162324576 [Organic Lake phycodnavirus 2]|jgi:hypothetical protein|nr:hypothetical protein 162324576 [Organic Lake phycodnavirus 2]